ncbi:MAG: hypothetical protein ACI9TH_005238 [Kiritimatiellia bacterium]
MYVYAWSIQHFNPRLGLGVTMKKISIIILALASFSLSADAAFLLTQVRSTTGGFGNGNVNWNVWNNDTSSIFQPRSSAPHASTGQTFDINYVGRSDDLVTLGTLTNDVIDFGGGGGNFNAGSGGNPQNQYPAGPGTGGSQYSIRAFASITFPAHSGAPGEGEYTIGFGSDDGGYIELPGVTYIGDNNANANNIGGTGLTGGDLNTGGSILWFGNGRGHNWTRATFSIPSTGLKTTINAAFWEGGGGDSWELAIRDSFDLGGAVNQGTGWELLTDGVFGISVTDDFGRVPEPSTSVTLIFGVSLLCFFRRLRDESRGRGYAKQLK